MPYIKVDTRRLSDFGNAASSSKSRVGNIKSSFSSIGSSLDWDVKACSGINSAIRQINNELSSEMSSLGRMESFFHMAVRKYNDAEKSKDKLSKIPQTRRASALVHGGNIKNKTGNVVLLSIFKTNRISMAGQIEISDDIKDKVKSLLLKISKKAGIVGSLISIADDESSFFKKIQEGDCAGVISSLGILGKSTYKTISKVIKKGANMAKVSPMLHWTTQAKSWGKTLLGVENYFNPKTVGVASKASKTSTRIYNNFQKTRTYEFGKITKADVVISGVFNAFKNYSEMKSGKIDAQRAVAETITETAIDVVVDAALYAGIAAVLAGVAGTAAVPALAIGAVVVTTKWFLDIATNAITGTDGGFTEYVSDKILDFAEYAGDAVKKVKNAVVSSVVKTCSNIFLRNAKNTVSCLLNKLSFSF